MTFSQTLPVITPWDNTRNTTEAGYQGGSQLLLGAKISELDNLPLCDIALRAARKCATKTAASAISAPLVK